MKNKRLKIQNCCLVLGLALLSSLCQAKPMVDDRFIDLFPTEMQPKIKMMCEIFSQSTDEKGLYYSQTMFGQYKFIGFNKQKYQILKFEKKPYEPHQLATLILDLSGNYTKNGVIIHLEKSKQDDDFIAQDLILVQNQTDQYVVNDAESVARQMSWNDQFGSEEGFLKKIDCTEQSYKNYSGEEEAPSYLDLPTPLKAMVLEKPLHALVHTAQNIQQELLESDDPETPVEQIIKINTPDASKLFKHQQICIIQGHGKGWSGMIEKPKQPFSDAFIFVYTSDPSEKLAPAQQSDIISTSEKDCQ